VTPVAATHTTPRQRRLAARATPRVAAAVGGTSLDEEQFARDLSLMLRSGLGVMDALETFREQATGAAATVLATLVLRLESGEALAAAMAASGRFSPGLLACVKASEVTGDLDESLLRFATNATRLRQMRSKLVSALVYPALLIVVAGAVVLFLLAYVVPRFALVLDNSQQALPGLSLALIWLGKALYAHQPLVWLTLAAVVVVGTLATVRASRAGTLAEQWTRLATRLPGLTRLVRLYGLGQTTRTAAMLVRSGIPALRALTMSRELLVPADRGRLDRAIRAATDGAPLAASLFEFGLLDRLGLQVLRVAEQTGALDLALDRLADVHEHHLERQLERAGRLIEPVVMLVIGLVIGGIVVLMYLPIFQLAASIQ
jgi:general secretion pathway protein F